MLSKRWQRRKWAIYLQTERIHLKITEEKEKKSMKNAGQQARFSLSMPVYFRLLLPLDFLHANVFFFFLDSSFRPEICGFIVEQLSCNFLISLAASDAFKIGRKFAFIGNALP